jgi:hypothetical protein
MGSASQQLSQLTDSGSLSLSLAYLLLCDAIFWVLATWFCISIFFSFSPPGFRLTSLWGFSPFFMPERIGLRQAVR